MSPASSHNKSPVMDKAEHNAFFPSAFSLAQFTASKTDFTPAADGLRYHGSKKILVIGTQERYLKMQNGRYFSTGNHPVEMLLPLRHLDDAGFECDIATPSGDMLKFEHWAFPQEDQAVREIFEKYQAKIEKPLDLREVSQNLTEGESPYCAVFIPGGHGVLNDIPTNKHVAKILRWALKGGHFIISLCHGPVALLAAEIDAEEQAFPFKGYEICVFPDSYDEENLPEIGYLPGKMPLLAGKELEKRGVKILNTEISGQVHRDRTLLTGDSPLAANALGLLAAKTLLESLEK